MKGIFKPIDYRTHEQDTSHIHYGKVVTILEKDRFGYCFSIDDFPNCNHREKQNRFHAGYEEIEIIDRLPFEQRKFICKFLAQYQILTLWQAINNYPDLVCGA